MVMMKLLFALSVFILLPLVAHAQSELEDLPKLVDPFDPFDKGDLGNSQDDKSAEELIQEGASLLTLDRPLDARTKLLQALKKDPKQYRAYYLLAGYYMVNVAHYRLALRYIDKAFELFQEQKGRPPYFETMTRLEHGQMLYYLSQIKLNLDDYRGSLDTLDEYTKYGYFDVWYPSSRAWTLMKLGKIEEAIRVARMGTIVGGDDGRILNMLGILLSMHDERDESLEVFRKAIATELSLGTEGNPATPLNNSGEVFKEIYQEDKAESSWLRALSLPDGCEHVLPTLNLTLLYIEQLRFEAANRILDDFEGCVKQYSLKNDEEHKGLVLMARGRIALHTGRIRKAIEQLERALDSIQWFGKIGTSQEDLKAALLLSLSQAYDRFSKMIPLERPASWSQWANSKADIATAQFKSWWYMRRAKEMLLEDLEDFEDLSIRNTDSMLEYPTLGELVATLPKGYAKAKLADEKTRDSRSLSRHFYDAYSAESSLGWWTRSSGLMQVDSILKILRPKYDDLLRVHLLLLKLKYLPIDSQEYRAISYEVFKLSPSHLRNSGFKLPVAIVLQSSDRSLANELNKGPFVSSADFDCRITTSGDSDVGYTAKFECKSDSSKTREIGDKDPAQVVNRLSDMVFSEEFVGSGKKSGLY